MFINISKNIIIITVILFLSLNVNSQDIYTPEALLDQIIDLPGAENLLSNHFSGYLDITLTKHIHYIYIESHRNPVQDSVIFWTNGGPGCSGLLGLFTEMGPWRPLKDLTLQPNPYSWTTIASMVFLEQPIGTGYSYASDASEYNLLSDYTAAKDNVKSIKEFFIKFPERINNTVYLASESYGGHYIPQLTLELFEENDDDFLNRFGGFLVGNPFTSFASGDIAGSLAKWGEQLVPITLWRKFVNNTCIDLSHTVYDYPTECWNLLYEIDDFTSTLNPYALNFPVCTETNQPEKKSKAQTRIFQNFKEKYIDYLVNNNNKNNIKRFNKYNINEIDVKGQLIKKSNLIVDEDIKNFKYDPCTESYTEQYLNIFEVREALHISNKTQAWSECSNIVWNNWPIMDFYADTTSQYSQIYNHKKRKNNFKMLVYSGDSDSVCATIGTQDWIYSIAGSTINSLWIPWYTSNGQTSGFLTKFSGAFSFATVHFSGHEVPAYQPERALTLFTSFINGSIFDYNKEVVHNYDDNTYTTKILFEALGVVVVVGLCLYLFVTFMQRYNDTSVTGQSLSKLAQSAFRNVVKVNKNNNGHTLLSDNSLHASSEHSTIDDDNTSKMYNNPLHNNSYEDVTSVEL